MKRVLSTCGRGTRAWFVTRNYFQLLFGVPAIVMVLPLVICFVRMPFYTSAAKAAHYRNAARVALNVKDYDKAQLYYRKITQLKGPDEAGRYQVAVTLAKDGRWVDAYRQMKELATFDPGSLPVAHLWIADAAMRDKLELSDEQNLQILQRHLDHLHERFPQDVNIAYMRARMFRRMGNDELSEKELSQFEDADMAIQVQLANIKASKGNIDEALQNLQRVDRHYNEYRKNGRLGLRDYLVWSSAHEIFRDFGRAETLLLEAKQVVAEKKDVDAALLELYNRWFVVVQNYSKNYSLLLSIGKKALALDPNDQDALLHLASLGSQTNDEGRQARQRLQPILQDDQVDLTLLRQMASAAATRGSFVESQRLLERVWQRDEQDGAVANNLAWFYSNIQPRDLPKALKMVEHALRLEPDRVEFRETRGQIFAKMERWADAVRDLEFAVNGLVENQEVHEALADSYGKLGDEARSQAHRRVAEDLANRSL